MKSIQFVLAMAGIVWLTYSAINSERKLNESSIELAAARDSLAICANEKAAIETTATRPIVANPRLVMVLVKDVTTAQAMHGVFPNGDTACAVVHLEGWRR